MASTPYTAEFVNIRLRWLSDDAAHDPREIGVAIGRAMQDGDL
jgi:hypothetical protein